MALKVAPCANQHVMTTVAGSWNFPSYFSVISRLFHNYFPFLTYFPKIYQLFLTYFPFLTYFSIVSHFSLISRLFPPHVYLFLSCFSLIILSYFNTKQQSKVCLLLSSLAPVLSLVFVESRMARLLCMTMQATNHHFVTELAEW